MKNRSELREIIMKVMYQIYILEDAKLEYNLDYLIKEQLEVENEFINNTVTGILKEQVSIDLLANKYLKNWEINRLNKVDKGIVSLGIYELMYTDTPSVVAINEAIELSKKYSDEKVTKMINAVLDEIFHNELEEQK
ncbi:MAG: transcription antitermination factor NusB [Bacilli bacterium]|nr:transcription antitermination factor NusB [Bacilli bacterium]